MIDSTDSASHDSNTQLPKRETTTLFSGVAPTVQTLSVPSAVQKNQQNTSIVSTNRPVHLQSPTVSSFTQSISENKLTATNSTSLPSQHLPDSSSVAISMSAHVFENYRQYIYSLTGIWYSETKKYLLESKLLKRLQHNKLNGFDEYLSLLQRKVSPKEATHFYDAITINETFFFRNNYQNEIFISSIIPEILASQSSNTECRIWSAASSSGEEAYTLAIIIAEYIKPKYPSVDFKIFGTDINSAVIDQAKNGVYKDYAVRQVQPYLLQKYFRREGDTYYLSNTIKSMVDYSVVNLYDQYAVKQLQQFDVIVCANVLIYFDENSKKKVVDSLYSSLKSGGFLSIGNAETLMGISNNFELRHFPKVVVYKKR